MAQNSLNLGPRHHASTPLGPGPESLCAHLAFFKAAPSLRAGQASASQTLALLWEVLKT